MVGRLRAAVEGSPRLTRGGYAELAGGPAGWRILHCAETGSTNADARGGRHGDVFVADYQTAGRGRLDHRWLAPRGANVAMSAVLSVEGLSPECASTLPLVAGLAVARGVSSLFAGRGAADPECVPMVKWPNDVLVGGRKVAGILCERVGDLVVVGIGVNVAEREFPPELAGRAAALAEMPGFCGGVAEVRDAVLVALRALYAQWREGGFAAVWPDVAAIDFLRGRVVSVRQTDADPEPVRGTSSGILRDGSLDVGGVKVHAGEAHAEKYGPFLAMGLLFAALCSPVLLAAGDSDVQAKIETLRAGRMTVVCAKPEGWRFSLACVEAEGDLEVVRVVAESENPAVPPSFKVKVTFPCVDMAHLWKPEYAYDGARPCWSSSDTRPSRTSFAWWTPVYCLHNANDLNRFTIATSEYVRDVPYSPRIREETLEASHQMTFFPDPVAPMSRYETLIRLDRRAVFYGRAIEDATEWMLSARGERPAKTPPAAFAPLYSSWYSFHQNVFDRDIEAECDEAAKLGMKTLIVDDGWQTDDTNRGYAFCGDWQISTNRFPNMREHVARVQAKGMKYLLWYSMPMVGRKSAAYGRFKGRYLREDGDAAILDPRFPEVRAFLAELYERAAREWNLDGFKLDFINSFSLLGKEDPAVRECYAGRDIREIPAAVEAVVAEAVERIRAVRPDALIEFRQTYMGPGVRKYGNMFRVADCCGIAVANRAGIASLRLTSGGNAVHSDMLAWHPSETPEQAARQVLSSLFGTVQYSMMLRTLPESHKRMMAHWIRFSREHETSLLHGAFRPRHPELDYPLIEGESAGERVIVAYVDTMAVDCGPADKAVYVVNATGANRLTMRLAAAPSEVAAFNTFGEAVSVPPLVKGVQDVPLPPSGYLRILFGDASAGHLPLVETER